MRHTPILLSLLILTVAMSSGCGRSGGSYSDDGTRVRDIPGAHAAYREAVEHRAENPEKAEIWLRRALDRDLYNGPAHNDLGVLLLAQGRLYEAAAEFNWARKLMPGHPDPRVNLAIVLDRGGKRQESLDAARAALEVRPGYLPAVQALAMIQCRYGLEDEATRGHLEQILLQADEQRWRDWARHQQLRLEVR